MPRNEWDSLATVKADQKSTQTDLTANAKPCIRWEHDSLKGLSEGSTAGTQSGVKRVDRVLF